MSLSLNIYISFHDIFMNRKKPPNDVINFQDEDVFHPLTFTEEKLLLRVSRFPMK